MAKKISVVNYGLGNIFSVAQIFTHLDFEVEIVTTPAQIAKAEFLVLPGVGAMQKGMQQLIEKELAEPLKSHAQTGKPLLGICLGMQLFFDTSEENGMTPGLGLIPGKVVKIVPEHSQFKVPHIGWSKLILNQQHIAAQDFLTSDSLEGKYAYFVHSYHPEPENTSHLLATSLYHDKVIHAMVMKDNIIGCQFHPEKSGVNLFKFLQKIASSF